MADQLETTERPHAEQRQKSAEGLKDQPKTGASAAGDAQDGGKPGDGADKAAERKPRALWPRLLLAFVVIAGILGGGYYWLSTRNIMSTDDAFTDGRAITVAPQVSGYVVALDVNDNQRVHAGDTLIEIDPRSYAAARDQAQGNLEIARAQLTNARLSLDTARVDYPAKLASARAQLASAQANQINAQSEYKRQHSVAKGATTQQSVDQSTAGLQAAQAQVDQAQAQVHQADLVPQFIAQAEAQVKQLEGQVTQAQAQLDTAALNLSWTKVVAPQDGWITKRNVEMGNYVQPGQSIFSIVAPQVWVTANFKETELNRIRPGQQVRFRLDAYPDMDLHGHVDSIQLGTGSKFTAFPPENATGNFVKIVQRVPVKMLIDSGLDPNRQLPLGISIVPTVSLQ